MKKYQIFFLSENVQFLEVKFSIYLNGLNNFRSVFMDNNQYCPWSQGFREFYYSLQAEFIHITKTHLFKYIEHFTTQNWKFSDKNSYIFHISVQNIDCGYSLEPRF